MKPQVKIKYAGYLRHYVTTQNLVFNLEELRIEFEGLLKYEDRM